METPEKVHILRPAMKTWLATNWQKVTNWLTTCRDGFIRSIGGTPNAEVLASITELKNQMSAVQAQHSTDLGHALYLATDGDPSVLHAKTTALSARAGEAMQQGARANRLARLLHNFATEQHNLADGLMEVIDTTKRMGGGMPTLSAVEVPAEVASLLTPAAVETPAE